MKKMTIYFVGLVIFTLLMIKTTYADEFSELKEQMKAMQERMEIMQKTINRLEAERALTKESVQTRQMEEMQRKIENLETQASISDEGQKTADLENIFHKIEWHGEVEWEFVDTMKDDSTGEAEPHFQLDKVRLEPEIQITEDIRFEADLDFDGSSAEADEFYFIFENLPFNSTMQIGKDDRFFKADKMTERYPLAGNAFWKDEEIGFLLETEHEPFYAALSWSQGLELDFKDVGEDDTSDVYSLMQDDTRRSSFNGVKEVSIGVGIEKDIEDLGKIDVLVWGLYNQLSAADISFLKTNLNSYSVDTHDQYRAGVNVEYEIDHFSFVSQYIDAKDGQLERYAWFVQPSYKFELPFGWKYANDHRLLFRYGKLVVDSPKTFDKPVSWDRKELTFAVITDITKNFRLKTEYTIDEEKTGAGDVDNNEFVAQLEYEF